MRRWYIALVDNDHHLYSWLIILCAVIVRAVAHGHLLSRTGTTLNTAAGQSLSRNWFPSLDGSSYRFHRMFQWSQRHRCIGPFHCSVDSHLYSCTLSHHNQSLEERDSNNIKKCLNCMPIYILYALNYISFTWTTAQFHRISSIWGKVQHAHTERVSSPFSQLSPLKPSGQEQVKVPSGLSSQAPLCSHIGSAAEDGRMMQTLYIVITFIIEHLSCMLMTGVSWSTNNFGACQLANLISYLLFSRLWMSVRCPIFVMPSSLSCSSEVICRTVSLISSLRKSCRYSSAGDGFKPMLLSHSYMQPWGSPAEQKKLT